MLLRIVSCDYNMLIDSFVLCVDIFYSMHGDSSNDRTMLITIPRKNAVNQRDFESYVEKEVLSQNAAMPDWTGHTWRMQVEPESTI